MGPDWITPEMIDEAFDEAERETAKMFDGQTCVMTDVNGEERCPICYFRSRVKAHLFGEPCYL